MGGRAFDGGGKGRVPAAPRGMGMLHARTRNTRARPAAGGLLLLLLLLLLAAQADAGRVGGSVPGRKGQDRQLNSIGTRKEMT